MGNRINFDLTFFYKIFASKYLCLGLFVADMICYSIFFTTSIEFFCWFGIFLAIVTAVEVLLFGYLNKSNKGKYEGKHYLCFLKVELVSTQNLFLSVQIYPNACVGGALMNYSLLFHFEHHSVHENHCIHRL